MKIKALIFAVAALAGGSAFGASIYASSLVNADGGASDRLILGTAGTPLSSGYAGIGVFNGLSNSQVAAAANPTLVTTLTSSFVPIASDNFILGSTASYGGPTPGNFVINADPVVPTPFVGQTLFYFVGNGATLATSTAFVVFQLNQTISADPALPGLPIAYTFGINNGTLLLGTAGTFNGYSDSDLGLTNANISSIRLVAVAVPEPSVALLGAVGALGLLRRRRN